MQVERAYATSSKVLDHFTDSAVDFAANLVRPTVSFHGRVRDPFAFRQTMETLHEVVLGDYEFDFRRFVYDPVITVHPDEVFFEAFSQDESMYARLSAPLSAFEVEDAPTFGTTNIDFTWGLRQAMQRLRSSRPTFLTVGRNVDVATQVGERTLVHHEAKVELPESWVRGFLQVQSALMIRPFTFDVDPVALLNVITYFVEHNARKPPRGMRYEFRPEMPISVVLEPWEERFSFFGTGYRGYERQVRVWGRKRLEVLMRLLPYTDRVTIGVLGRGLPHFYICHVGEYRLLVMLSGWVRNDWTTSSAFDLLLPTQHLADETLAQVYNMLVMRLTASLQEIAAHTLLPESEVLPALYRLCRMGKAMYDPTTRQFRSRDLFGDALNFDAIFTPHSHQQQADALIAAEQVRVNAVFPSDTRRNEIKITGQVVDQTKSHEVLVAVDLEGQIRFAQCECAFFRDNVMSKGPCPHILALWLAGQNQLQSLQDSATLVESKQSHDAD